MAATMFPGVASDFISFLMRRELLVFVYGTAHSTEEICIFHAKEGKGGAGSGGGVQTSQRIATVTPARSSLFHLGCNPGSRNVKRR